MEHSSIIGLGSSVSMKVVLTASRLKMVEIKDAEAIAKINHIYNFFKLSVP